jgi:hypothetical protein
MKKKPLISKKKKDDSKILTVLNLHLSEEEITSIRVRITGSALALALLYEP